MEKPHWANSEKMRSKLIGSGRSGHVLWTLALIFAILGIIGDAANTTLGLESSSWFQLAIIMVLMSITFFIGWAVSWYLETKANKK